MKNHKVLLAGASGYLGRHIALELQKQGYPVRIILRNRKEVPFDTKNMEVVMAQVTNPESLIGKLGGIDVVISTVGITKQKDGFTYMDVDYQANSNLLEEAKKEGVKRFIYVSAFNADRIKHLKIAAAKEKFVDELKGSGLDYCILPSWLSCTPLQVRWILRAEWNKHALGAGEEPLEQRSYRSPWARWELVGRLLYLRPGC